MKKRLLSALAIVLVGAGAALLYWQSDDSTAPASGGPTGGQATADTAQQTGAATWPLARRFAIGAVEHYSFNYTQLNQTSPMVTQAGAKPGETGQVSLKGAVALSGGYSLEGRATDSATGNAEVLFRFEALDEHRFEVQGQPLLPDKETVAEQLLGAVALVTFTPRGEAQKISFEESAHPMFERMVQLVLSETQLTLDPTAEGWTTAEKGLHGVANTAYQVTDRGATRATLSKSRGAYDSLQALALHRGSTDQRLSYDVTAELSRTGRLLALAGDESLDALASGRSLLSVRTHVEVKHLRTTPGGQATAATFDRSRALGEIATTKELERQTLVQRVDGLTREQMVSDLREHGFAGYVPDHSRWLWRATGLLRLEPEIVDDLVAMFPSKKLSHEGRGLILDLLVGAQHRRAQAGLITALGTPAAKNDERYSMLFQRLNFLRHPSPDTIAFLQQTQAKSQGLQRDLATNSLGSAAGHLYRNGQIERGVKVGDALLDQLDEQGSPEAQQIYLTALGNAGLPHHAERLAAYASSSSSLVRYEVASSLRKLEDGKSRSTLITLAADRTPRVQIQALSTLHERRDITAIDVAQIGALVERRTLTEAALPSVITLLAPRLKTDQTVRAIFMNILTQDLENKDIKARIRAILGR